MVTLSETDLLVVRGVQFRDLEDLDKLANQQGATSSSPLGSKLPQSRFWYSVLRGLGCFPNPLQYLFHCFVAERRPQGTVGGFVRVAPFNTSRSTWKIEQLSVEPQAIQPELVTDPKGVGSQLLRHCFQNVWEARTWVLDVDVNDKNILALYRQNGFQPLAQITHWSLSAELLTSLAQNDPDLPNLLPVSNADAGLLCQLDCVSMPPLMRQVFDRHVADFKRRFLSSLFDRWQNWYTHREEVDGYVFEPQRKAAIAYFKLTLSTDGQKPHQAELTVHPAYTWLYPKLLVKMAQLVQGLPPQALMLESADYQHEREEYLEQLGAQRQQHRLLMSRSVWHKLKETKPERLQLSEVLQGLQPLPRTPIPSRISLLNLPLKSQKDQPDSKDKQTGLGHEDLPENGHHV
ncbi:GNAT family N-acetyltransferase [Synechocystis sp. CS-94]|nr:GNAT family N-acetyltransferase [Synechocystis sp. CS-94]